MRFSSPPVNVNQASGSGFGMGGIPVGGSSGGLGLNAGGPSQSAGYNAYSNLGSFGSVAGGGNPAGTGPASYPQVPVNNMMGMGMGGVPGTTPWGMGMNDATAQMGLQFGRSAMMAGHEYMEKNVSRSASSVQHFHVLMVLTTTQMPGHALSPTPTTQDVVLGDQLLRPPETPPRPVPVAPSPVVT
jgi:hypothetical protein